MPRNSPTTMLKQNGGHWRNRCPHSRAWKAPTPWSMTGCYSTELGALLQQPCKPLILPIRLNSNPCKISSSQAMAMPIWVLAKQPSSPRSRLSALALWLVTPSRSIPIATSNKSNRFLSALGKLPYTRERPKNLPRSGTTCKKCSPRRTTRKPLPSNNFKSSTTTA